MASMFAIYQKWIPNDVIPNTYIPFVMSYMVGVFMYINKKYIPLNLFALLTIPLAIASWVMVEKPALKLKGKIPMGRRCLDARVS